MGLGGSSAASTSDGGNVPDSNGVGSSPCVINLLMSNSCMMLSGVSSGGVVLVGLVSISQLLTRDSRMLGSTGWGGRMS